MNQEQINRTVFKYNMSFYYQSTIFYLAAFILYVIIRGEFVEDSFTLITKDPIIYFFAAIVLISVVSLFYNMYKQRRLEISGSEIAFINRNRTRIFPVADIKEIRMMRERGRMKQNVFRIIRIKMKNRRRPVLIRPLDYENEKKLIEVIEQLKSRLESNV
jgi:hypothetical protein